MKKQHKTEGFKATSCTGKEAFSERAMAQRVADRMMQRREVRASIYRCEFCSAWHVGTHTQPKAARRRP